MEDSLDILNRIEEYIMKDNRNFNDLVDLISGKNSEYENLPKENYIGSLNNSQNIRKVIWKSNLKLSTKYLEK